MFNALNYAILKTQLQQIASIGGQDLVDAAVAARDAAQGYAAQLAAGVASPAGVYANYDALVAADPDKSKIYLVLGTNGTAEVDTLTVTGAPSSNGDLSITLNGVTKTVAVLATDDINGVAIKIRAVAFTGWTNGRSGAAVTYTKNTVGTNTPVVFNAGATGVTATFTLSTPGVAATTSDWYYWDGSVWADGGVYQAVANADNSITQDMMAVDIFEKPNRLTLSNTETGKYQLGDGTTMAYGTTDIITAPVIPNTYLFLLGAENLAYIINQGVLGVYFDVNGAKVATVEGSGRTAITSIYDRTCILIKVPVGAVVMKLNVATGKGGTIYGAYLGSDINNPAKVGKQFVENTTLGNGFSTDLIKYYSDMGLTMGVSLSYNNTFVGSASSKIIPPFPVVEGDVYEMIYRGAGYESLIKISDTSGTDCYGIFLNADYTYNSLLLTYVDNLFTVPEGACYFMAEFASTHTIKTLKKVAGSFNTKVPESCIAYPESLLYGKKWLSYGDSITYQEQWQSYIADEFVLDHDAYGIAGASVSGTRYDAFWKPASTDVIVSSDPDILTILGGANDINSTGVIGTEAEFAKPLGTKDTDTFYGAYSHLIETVLTWKPTIRIIILGTMWAENDGAKETNISTGLCYKDYSDACAVVAAYYGLRFVNLHDTLGINEFNKTVYFNDGVIHPNALGGQRMAERIIPAFKEILYFV